MRKDANQAESLVYTADDIAAAMGISRNAAYSLFREPGFPCIHLGGRMMVAKDKFSEWLEHAHERPAY